MFQEDYLARYGMWLEFFRGKLCDIKFPENFSGDKGAEAGYQYLCSRILTIT